MKIGSHVSISGGLIKAAEQAHSYGANTFMIYTGAPQNTKRIPIENLKIKEGWEYMKKHNISDIVVHAPYVINLASYKNDIYNFGIEFLKKEIERTEAVKANYLVLHPGAYTNKTVDYGIKRISDALNLIINDKTNIVICLETMSGKGTEIGRNFEELKAIIEKINYKEKIGICFDTCHIFDSGYDIVNDFNNVIKKFDTIIGLDKLKVLHINGSLNKLGSKKDRHANIGSEEDNPIGKDNIGLEALYNIVHSKYTQGKIFILETPWINKKENLYKKEIEILRGDKSE